MSKRRTSNQPKKVNLNIFTTNFSPESAYILGMLWADGYIYKNSIFLYLKRDDAEIIRDVFMKTGDWNIYYRKVKGRKEQMCFNVCDKLIYDFLVENNYREKSIKSPFKILQLIPADLKLYFYRGYFDGDGTIWIGKESTQISITSTFDQDWGLMEELFTSLRIKYSISRLKYLTKTGKINKLSRIVCQNREGITKFLNYIYDGFYIDNIGFKRKYDKFMMIRNKKTLYAKTRMLFLDDEREPINKKSIVVRNFNQFEDAICKYGMFDSISLDNDLGEEKEGYDCVKWLVKNNYKIMEYNIHSQNTVAAANIECLINNYMNQ